MIADPDTSKELPYNTEGEICFAGPTVMIGYYENQEATDDLIRTDENGVRWLHTGDLGTLDENGVLRITGRIKRIVMTKGKDGNVTKLFPVRIENVVNEHPSVRVSCVIGIPDEERVNYPRAIVELNDGVEPSDALANDIKRFCAEHLPDYSLPDEVTFTDMLPRTARGKIDYRALEEEVQQ
jgi:long-chain acyl-CoA synthetase